MPKISALNSKSLLIRYTLCVVASSALCIILFSAAFSLIILKFDLSLSAVKYVSVVVAAISSVVISLISSSGFKNNFLLVCLISVIPFALFVFINMLVSETNSTICIIKLALIFLCATAVSLIKSAKKR